MLHHDNHPNVYPTCPIDAAIITGLDLASPGASLLSMLPFPCLQDRGYMPHPSAAQRGQQCRLSNSAVPHTGEEDVVVTATCAYIAEHLIAGGDRSHAAAVIATTSGCLVPGDSQGAASWLAISDHLEVQRTPGACSRGSHSGRG